MKNIKNIIKTVVLLIVIYVIFALHNYEANMLFWLKNQLNLYLGINFGIIISTLTNGIS